MIEYVDIAALHIGRVTLLILAIFIVFCIASLLFSWMKNCTSYWLLLLRAEKLHGDVIKEDYKRRFLWKVRGLTGTLFSARGIKLMLMESSTTWSNDRWSFNPKHSFVRGKVTK